jgi:glycolate oxidase
VVLTRTPEECVSEMSLINEAGFAVIPRGAGTGLAGGTLATRGAVVVALTRLRGIESLDPENGQALVRAGTINLAISRAARPHGLHYVPDPSSQSVCTLGGNIAGNSGGPHTLKAGVTGNHVLAVELVTADAALRWIGARAPARGGLDLLGLAVGSEGTLGLVTSAWVRLVPLPPAAVTVLAAFPGAEEASRAVSEILAGGVLPPPSSS